MRPDMRPMIFVIRRVCRRHAAPLAGCVTDEPRGGAPMPLVNAAGQTIGSVRAWQTAGRRDLPGRRRRACRTESTGSTSMPSAAATRPTSPAPGRTGTRRAASTGMNNPAGPHAGDLPNVTVAANGVLGETVTLTGASLTGPDRPASARRRRRGAGDPRRRRRLCDRPERQQRRAHRLRRHPPDRRKLR